MLFTQGLLILRIVFWIHKLNFCYLHYHALITTAHVHFLQPLFRSAQFPLAAVEIRRVR